MTLFSFIAHFIYCFINKNSPIHKAHLESIYLLVLTMMKNSRLILFFTFYIGCYFVLFPSIFINCNELFVKGEERLMFFLYFFAAKDRFITFHCLIFLMVLICFSVNFFVLYVYNKPWFGIQ